MSAPLQQRSFGRLKLGLVVGLTALAIVELALITPGKRPSEGVTAAIDNRSSLAIIDPSVSTYSAIVTNDLLAPSRKPSAGALARMAATSRTVGPEGTRLIGIVTAGETRIALLQVAGSAQPRKLRVGDTLGSARIQGITPTQIVLNESGRLRSLSIDHDISNAQSSNESAIADDLSALPSQGFDTRQGSDVYNHFMQTRQLGVTARDPTPSAPATSAP